MLSTPRSNHAAPHLDQTLMGISLLCFSLACGGCRMSPDLLHQPVKPPALEIGDTIAFVAPAGKVQRSNVMLAKQSLEKMGFVVRASETLFLEHGYLAGLDEVRAAEFMAAFTDPEIDAIFPCRGGSGTTRILDALDYDVIRKNPKILIGFSDITGLQLAISRRAGLICFHSPFPRGTAGGGSGLSEFSTTWFWRALLKSSYLDASGNTLPPGWTYDFPEPVARPIPLAAGKARGRLVGGNLSLVAATMGTPWEIQTRGNILFLEDVREPPYKIDRLLSTLRLAGKLDHLAGIILGKFILDPEDRDDPSSFTIETIFEQYFAHLNIPVMRSFPAGHHRHNATLPIGALIEIEVTEKSCRVTVLENPVDLRDRTTG